MTGEPLWFDPAAPEPPADVAYGALLLPLYDELTLTYPALNFPLAAGHPHPAGEDLFVGSVVLGDENVGTWRRTVRGRTVQVEVALAPGLLGGDQRCGRGRGGRSGWPRSSSRRAGPLASRPA